MVVIKNTISREFVSDGFVILFVACLAGTLILALILANLAEELNTIGGCIIVFLLVACIATAIYCWIGGMETVPKKKVIFNELTMQEIQEQYNVVGVDWPVFTIEEEPEDK